MLNISDRSMLQLSGIGSKVSLHKRISMLEGISLWLPEIGSVYEDSAGTVFVEMHGDPVGRMKDLGSNAMDATQSIASSRSEYRTESGIEYLYQDGVDDSFSIAFAGGAGPADCSLFMAIRTTDTKYILASLDEAAAYIGAGSVSTSSALSSALGGSIFVNGSSVADEREAFLNATNTGDWTLIEFRGLDLSAFAEMHFQNYSGWDLLGDRGAFAIVPTSIVEAANNRDLIMTYLAAKYGVTL